MSLYGDLPLKATSEIMSFIPNGKGVGFSWACFGKFLYDYCKEGNNEAHIDKISALMKTAFEGQHHSGGSWGVVIQEIMRYLSGQFTEKEKEFLKDYKTDHHEGIIERESE
ncbi:MAG: hypothetical protein ACRENZ_07690 [Thermodesulfobacteriota bacterium]